MTALLFFLYIFSLWTERRSRLQTNEEGIKAIAKPPTKDYRHASYSYRVTKVPVLGGWVTKVPSLKKMPGLISRYLLHAGKVVDHGIGGLGIYRPIRLAIQRGKKILRLLELGGC